MKILLINPPRSPENGILKYAPEEARYFIHKKLIGPPLGLLIVARALKDYDVTLFDAKGEYDLDPHAPPLNKMTISLLNEIKPDIVGVTTIASEFDYAMDIFNAVKEYNPDILTVAGGLHTSLCFEDFNHPAVDVICPGQSAFFFRDIIEAKKKGITLEKVPGIIINKNNKLIPVKGAEPKYI